jgi:hexulose-6-phosphate isomerase
VSYYKALNTWVLTGFECRKTVSQLLREVQSLKLDGIELTYGDVIKPSITRAECRAIRAEAKRLGVGLQTMASGNYWVCSLGSEDRAERKAAVDFTRRYIEVASWLGVKKILIVPAAVDVGWDPSRPVVSYLNAWKNSTASIRQLLPCAEKAGVTLCLENVWNKFLTSPMDFKAYVDQFNSRRVGVYFDIGNVIATGYPEHWIEILGRRIQAVHIKNFKRQDCGGVLHGFGEDLLDGDVNFKAVDAQLKKIRYRGPLTVEMIPFSRLPDLRLPDLALARKTAAAFRKIL